jgi:Polyketide cyclase / dehydrase and lipid transport
MVEYHDDGIFPFPRDQVWRLLRAHLDPVLISQIHPLVKSHEVVKEEGEVVTVRRSIDVRGKLVRSEWKITSRPPETSRWEIVTSEGPWSAGSWIENRYSDASGGTRIQTQGDVKVKVLPFFLPQGPFVRGIFRDIDEQDAAFLRR